MQFLSRFGVPYLVLTALLCAFCGCGSTQPEPDAKALEEEAARLDQQVSAGEEGL
jgi:hypothetical protein